jgi:cbb3-type cytochrome oxidase cytochrome c subunit
MAKANTPTKLVVDCETGDITSVPLTPEEIAEATAAAEAYAAEQAAIEAEAQAKADAKASAITKLTALGLSDAEVAALVG